MDQRAPLFFLSYGHVEISTRSPAPTPDPNRYALRLFHDLSMHVSLLVGRAAGADPGFMDRSLAGGERWTPELLRAAGTCQVFVPLISSALLNSQWCAMEWDAFSRRKIVRRDGRPDHESGIVPVVWSPTESDSLPAVVRDVQRFSPVGLPDPIAAEYHRDGLYGLLAMSLPQYDQYYAAVVWRLAQRVVAVYRSHWVEEGIPVDPGELRNVFVEEKEE